MTPDEHADWSPIDFAKQVFETQDSETGFDFVESKPDEAPLKSPAEILAVEQREPTTATPPEEPFAVSETVRPLAAAEVEEAELLRAAGESREQGWAPVPDPHRNGRYNPQRTSHHRGVPQRGFVVTV